MQRPWLVLVGVVVALLLVVWLLGDVITPASDPEHDPLDPEWERQADEADAQGDAPALRGTAAKTPGRAGEGTPVEGAPAGVRGTGELLVLSHETYAPIEEAAILDEAGTKLAETDEEGLVTLPDLPAGGVLYRIQRAGYLPGLERARPNERLEVTLQPGVPVSGKLVRVGTTEGKAQAEVFVLDEDLQLEIASFTTDEEGRFEIPAVRPNRPFLMTIRMAGIAPQTKRLVVDMPRDDLEIPVGEGGILTGYVRTADDLPVKDREVRLLRTGQRLPEFELPDPRRNRAQRAHALAGVPIARTDEEGRYELIGLPIGVPLHPIVVAGGRQTQRAAIVEFAEPGESRQLDWVLRDPGTLRIEIVDDAGTKLGDMDLYVDGTEGRYLPRDDDERKDGALIMKGLPAGGYHVVAQRPGSAPRSATTTLAAGGEARVELRFPKGATVKGRVRDKRGAPIWKALVQWYADDEQVQVRTEADGSFELQRLTKLKGAITVTAIDLPASRFGYETKRVEDIEAGGPPLDIELLDGTRIHGVFEGLPAGQTVDTQMYPGTDHDRAELLPDDEFRFVRRGARVGKQAIFTFRTRGLPPILRFERSPFQSEEDRDLGTLAFEPHNARKGRIIGDDGLPVWAAKVTLRTHWAQDDVRTDRQGDFAFPHMPRVPLDVLIEADGYSATPAKLHTKSEFTRQIIELRKQVEVIVVTEQDGKRIPAKLVFERTSAGVDERSGRTVRSETGRRGFVRLQLRPGFYDVEVSSGSKQTTQTVSITNKRRQYIQLDLR